MGPQASKMSPRASKITQNHESGHPKSRKSLKKKLQEMARWRVMRAAHWILAVGLGPSPPPPYTPGSPPLYTPI